MESSISVLISAKQQALRLARGSYQRAIVNGQQTLGGSTLRGKMKNYAGRYQASARNVLARIESSGIPHRVERGPRGGWWTATLVFES